MTASRLRAPGEPLRIGFMPLLDSAMLVAAARCGFAARHGLSIALVRETSWANIRDRLAIGHFDAAHTLAPLPIAAALGLTPYDVPLVAPLALATGGNAITLSPAIWEAMRAAKADVVANDPVSTGAALKAVIAQRRAAGEKPLVIAVVHPYSAHNYELRYWLAASGIDPETDVAIAILPPPFMPDALAAGRIDGFCVGEPWNSVAAARGAGRIVLTKPAIWSGSIDKVLALRADWAEANAEPLRRLLAALLESARWCAEPANRDGLAAIMSAPDILDVPVATVLPALSGRLDLADGPGTVPGMLEFAAGAAPFPWPGQAEWLYRQMVRWNQVEPSLQALARARACFAPHWLRELGPVAGFSWPLADDRAAAAARVEGTAGPVDLPECRLFDEPAQDLLKHPGQAG